MAKGKGSKEDDMKELITMIAKALVDLPDQVEVE